MTNPFDAVLASRKGQRQQHQQQQQPEEEEKEDESSPVLRAGDEIMVALKEADLVRAKVTKVKQGPEKKRRGPWIYSLEVNRKKHRTRLTHLKWSFVRSKYVSLLERGGVKIVAPMVGGSELAFRVLAMRYGAEVAYTPMLAAEDFATSQDYREKWLQPHDESSPLIAHFSANDPEILGRACALAVKEGVDGVDLNLGCPQRIAYSGHFGSYLLGPEDRDLVLQLVRAMRSNVPGHVAVCVKIRLLDTHAETVSLVQGLRTAGADVVAIHARKRATWHKKGPGARDGPADLSAVRRIVDDCEDIHIVTNGNVRTFADLEKNLLETKASGIMVAEALLNDPTLFSVVETDALDVALEYLDLVDQHGNPAGQRSINFHVRRICVTELEKYDLLDDLIDAPDLATARHIVTTCHDYASGKATFHPDPGKKKRALELKQRRADARQARRRFEERMARKAKRLGKPLDFFLTSKVPTPSELTDLQKMSTENERLTRWKALFPQVCFQFHLNPSGCSRGDTCAFLHTKASEDVSSSKVDDDALVSG